MKTLVLSLLTATALTVPGLASAQEMWGPAAIMHHVWEGGGETKINKVAPDAVDAQSHADSSQAPTWNGMPVSPTAVNRHVYKGGDSQASESVPEKADVVAVSDSTVAADTHLLERRYGGFYAFGAETSASSSNPFSYYLQLFDGVSE